MLMLETDYNSDILVGTTPRGPTTTVASTGTTPVCVLSQWTTWSNCTSKCQSDRYQQRTRSVLNGTCSDRLSELRPCENVPCEICTLTRESYIAQLEQTPPGDGKSRLFERKQNKSFSSFHRLCGILYGFYDH